jgi:hypothetical protein
MLVMIIQSMGRVMSVAFRAIWMMVGVMILLCLAMCAGLNDSIVHWHVTLRMFVTRVAFFCKDN